jgi:hypothetical protein
MILPCSTKNGFPRESVTVVAFISSLLKQKSFVKSVWANESFAPMLETNYYDCCQYNKGDGSNNSTSFLLIPPKGRENNPSFKLSISPVSRGCRRLSGSIRLPLPTSNSRHRPEQAIDGVASIIVRGRSIGQCLETPIHHMAREPIRSTTEVARVTLRHTSGACPGCAVAVPPATTTSTVTQATKRAARMDLCMADPSAEGVRADRRATFPNGTTVGIYGVVSRVSRNCPGAVRSAPATTPRSSCGSSIHQRRSPAPGEQAGRSRMRRANLGWRSAGGVWPPRSASCDVGLPSSGETTTML